MLRRRVSRPIRVLLWLIFSGVFLLAGYRLLSPTVRNALLGRAVVRGDYPTAKWLLEQGADPQMDTGNIIQETCEPLIITPIRQGDIKLVRLLLDKGASPNDGGMWGNTALSEAVGARKADIVRLLIDRGADVTFHSEEADSSSLLVDSKRKWDEAIVQLLKQSDARK